MRVVIGEDLALLRDGLIRLLTAYRMEVVEAVDSGPALVRPSAISASTSRSRGVSADSGPPVWCRASSWDTTSGSRTVPPAATTRTASTNRVTSATRSFSRYPTPPRPSATSSRA